MHGIQAWVALPERDEETDPAFFHHSVADLPVFEEQGSWARLIADQAFGSRANVSTHSPLFYLHWELHSGSQTQLPTEYSERAVFVVVGSIEIDGHPPGAAHFFHCFSERSR